MSRLIVNADDFGYTPGVNQAVLELHAAGALSSCTLMATGAALDDALQRFARYPGARTTLGLGCHVILVDGAPVSPAADIPSLLDPSLPPCRLGASFRPTLAGFVADLVRGRIAEAEIEREAVAQIRQIQSRLLQCSPVRLGPLESNPVPSRTPASARLTHLDTHKHTHMFPRVLRPLLRAALQCGIKAVRNPFEPAWSIRATVNGGPAPPLVRRAEVRLLSLLRPAFTRLVAEAGILSTDGALGVLATGTLDASTLERLFTALRDADASLPSGRHEPTWELVCHPAHYDAALDALPTRLRAAREVERTALAAALPAEGVELVHFGNLRT